MKREVHLHLYEPYATEAISGGQLGTVIPNLWAPIVADQPGGSPGAGPQTFAQGAFAAQRRTPLRDRLRERLRAEVLAQIPAGTDPARVEDAIADLDSERPLLDWLLNGGFEKLVKLVLELLKLAA